MKDKESWISDSYGVHRCDTRNGYQKIGSEESFFPGGASKKRWDCLIDLLPEYQKIVDDFKLIQPWKNVENL